MIYILIHFQHQVFWWRENDSGGCSCPYIEIF